MALQIKSLATGTLQTTESDLYVAPSGKAAIVKTIRLVCTSGTATVNLFIRRGGGTPYRIAKKDFSVAVTDPAFIDNNEITLEGFTPNTNSDRIRGIVAGGATVDFVLSGVERDQT